MNEKNVLKRETENGEWGDKMDAKSLSNSVQNLNGLNLMQMQFKNFAIETN